MNKSLVISITSGALVVGILIYLATLSGTSKVYLPSEIANISNLNRIRVAGKVTEDKVLYQTEPKIKLEFRISNPDGEKSTSLPIVYNGIKPDMFASGRDIIVDGNLVGGVLEASSLLTQCPSKYEPPNPEERY